MKTEQRQGRPLIVGIGEVLWDLLPSGRQLGGAPANFAYHAHALGAEARVVSRVGNDPLGREILERLKSLHLEIEGVSVDDTASTGTVSVALSPDGQPQFTIHENVAWDHLAADQAALDLASRADAVCFGSLAQRAEQARTSIRRLVTATSATAWRVFDINLRQHFYSREILDASLRISNVLKLNDAELPVLAKMFNLPENERRCMEGLLKQFRLRAVALTRGARGSLLLSADRWSEHPGIPSRVVDSVGAGDAFTAAMTLGLLAGWDLDDINQKANKVAAYVCTQSGATPLLPVELAESFRKMG